LYRVISLRVRMWGNYTRFVTRTSIIVESVPPRRAGYHGPD
jgi:hypothetical protein